VKELLEFIVQRIIGEEEKFTVTESDENGFTRLTITIPKEKVGIIIGKEGRIIKSIKIILSAFAKTSRFAIDVKES